MCDLSPEVTASAVAAARTVAERHDLATRLIPYEPYRWRQSLPHLPVLCLDDVSAIPFLIDIAGVGEYQHRARLRAGDGDLFAANTPQTLGYESYCRDPLGLGAVDFLLADAKEGSLEVASACANGAALDRLAKRAREERGLILHPYMGIEPIWDLARLIHEVSGLQTTVLAPPPPVTWIANDKAAFGEVVRSVLGREWLVETHEARSPSALAGHLQDLCKRHSEVALKRLRCASAMGNAVFASDELRTKSRAEIERLVRSFLTRTEWDGAEDVQAVAWEDTDLSPSTQLWIPPEALGPPKLDGVYEQILEGEQGVFLGSRPSTMPERVNRALGTASLRVAAGLQWLGYVGRCSFDFLVVGNPEGPFELRFTECNGRWGGTSTPMALLDRLLGGPRPPYRAQDFVRPGLIGTTFKEILAAVGSDLYEPAAGTGRFIFYNVGPLHAYGKLDVISIGRTQQEAEEGILEVLPRRLGV